MLLCAENVAVQPMTGATHCGGDKTGVAAVTGRQRLGASADSTTGPWRPGGGKLEEAERPLLEAKILSRHDPAGQRRRREPAAYLGTILGPHVVRGDERSARL
jgi:hypothetical protein